MDEGIVFLCYIAMLVTGSITLLLIYFMYTSKTTVEFKGLPEPSRAFYRDPPLYESVELTHTKSYKKVREKRIKPFPKYLKK